MGPHAASDKGLFGRADRRAETTVAQGRAPRLAPRGLARTHGPRARGIQDGRGAPANHVPLARELAAVVVENGNVASLRALVDGLDGPVHVRALIARCDVRLVTVTVFSLQADVLAAVVRQLAPVGVLEVKGLAFHQKHV